MPHSLPPFPDVSVLLGDPRLPDRTKVGHRFGPEDLEAIGRLKQALFRIPGYRFRYLDDHAALLSTLCESPPQFVLNLCDTGYRNDPAYELHVPAILEWLGIPYSGAPPSCMAVCYDKSWVRAIAESCGIPVPREQLVEAGSDLAEIELPALIKPARGDGSLGITQEAVVHDLEAAERYLDQLFRQWPDRPALVQEFLGGAEYSLALVGNPPQGLTAFPLLEVDYGDLDPSLPRLLGYESKTIPSSPYWTKIRYRRAELPKSAFEALVESARLLFRRLGCRDYARFDFRGDSRGEIKLLEVNPNPAWCWDGKLNLMASLAGLDYPAMLQQILTAAQTRAAEELKARSA